MKEIKRIRKELDVTQIRVAQHIKIKQYQYSRIENSTCDIETKDKIIGFLMMQCYNTAESRTSLGITQRRLAKLLGMQYTHLCESEKKGRKIKGLKEALLKERERRMSLKDILANMLKQ